jgi:hypothetical protein
MALQLLDVDDVFEVKDSDLDGVQDGDADAIYVLRKLIPEKTRSIRKAHTKHARNGRTGVMEATTDEEAIQDALIDYVLTDWRGITLKGQPAPCDRFHKVNGLDPVRKSGILVAAGMNQHARTQEERAESFRVPASLL